MMADDIPSFDQTQPLGSGPPPFEATQPSGAKSFSDRVSNMWDKATPGGPLWMIKQSLQGMKTSVEAAKAATSTPQTEEEQFQQNQGRDVLPAATMQAAQFLTPAAPKGTGGLFAAPFRAAEEAIPAAATANRELANEFGINLSRGQSTQDLDRIRYEDMASRGAYGKESQDRAAAFFQKQFEDSQAAGHNIGEQTARTAPVVDNPAEAASVVSGDVSDRGLRGRQLQEQVDQRAAADAEAQRGIVNDQGRALDDTLRQGALPIENPREAGEVVGQNVREAAQANRQEFRNLYDEFGRLPGEFRVDAVRGMGTRIRNELTYGSENPVIIDEGTPTAMRAITALDEMSRPHITNLASPHADPNPEEIAAVSLRGIDQMRKRLVGYYQQARANPSDARATRAVLNGFDDQIERAITENLFSGDPRALQALQDARASYSRYRNTFGPQRPGDDVGTAMRRIVDRNATPEEISNMIIGSGKIGNAGLPVRIADRLEQILGADSDSWSAIRQAMWQKASQVRNSSGAVDPVRSSTSISDFVGSTLAQRMFTPQERAAMRAHAQGVRDLDRSIEELPATQTANRVRQAYQDVFGGADIGGSAGSTFRRVVEGTATPEEIVNGVFKVIGSQNPGNTARAIGAIERIVGPDSPAMGAVRQGVWQKLTQAASGKDQPGAQKAMQAINEFLNGTGRTVAEQLYSDSERALMKRYADALKLTIIPKYARTNSDTAPALLAAVRKYGAAVMGALGYVHGDGGLAGLGVGKMLEWGANRIEGAAQTKKLGDSLDNIIPKAKPYIGDKQTPNAIVRKAISSSTNRASPDLKLLQAQSTEPPERRKSDVARTGKVPTTAGFARGGHVNDDSSSGREIHSSDGTIGEIAHRARGGAVHNHNPTEPQKQAGNYSKTHRYFQGLDITLENLKGHSRSGVGKDGKRWSVSMPAHYGYIKRSEGADGDNLDVYLLPNEKSDQVFVIDQKDYETGRFDEHKIVLGASSEKEALKTYRAGFSDGKDRVKHVRRMTMSEFKTWLAKGDTSKPIKNVALRLAYEGKRAAQ